MQADDSFKLYHILTCSYPHLRQLKPKKLNATFKATKDLYFEGFPKSYCIDSMTRMQGNRYLVNVANCCVHKGESHCVDLNTMTAESHELNARYGINNSFVDGEYMLLVVCRRQPMIILRDLVEIGQIEFDAKYNHCKNGKEIRGRHAHHVGHSLYALDDVARLY